MMTVSPVGAEFWVNTFTVGEEGFGLSSNSTAMDADGNFVVTWVYRGGDVYAQRYNAAGAAQGAEFRVTTSTYTRRSPS